jgi:histidine triad (HIT) family protein
MEDPDCIFCKIAKGQIPSAKVYESNDVLAFLDISPANKGHCLVIPKRHFETLTDMPDIELAALSAAVKKVALSVYTSLKADGFNIFMNNKKAAGQIVPHAHFHIVPRFKDDGISFDWPHRKYGEGELEEYAGKIKVK